MNYNQFMEEIQIYYGTYPKGSKVGNYVQGYLERDIDETKLDRLFRFVTYNHPFHFGAPGIVEIEKSISEALYKKKGEDVHKISFYTTQEKERPNTQKEAEQIKLLLQRLNNELENNA